MCGNFKRYHRVIGIDLGTTYSAVAAYDPTQDQAVVLSDPEEAGTKGQTTPSVTSYDRVRHKVMVGYPAKRNMAADPSNTIIEVKREMGELFRPETLAKYDSRGAGGFRAREDVPGGYAGDPVKMFFRDQWRRPQEISALTLMRMKWIAEQHLGGEIVDAVITVPAYFKASQKKATEEAAYLAGLYPRQLIPEPTAAAICYGLDTSSDERKIYLVYDLGGGTFDVSVIAVEGERIEVLATSGDSRLGGGDFDDAITRWAVEDLARNHGIDIRNDPRAQAIVKHHAEQLKIRLSVLEEESMELAELRPNPAPVVRLARKKFEDMISGHLDRSLNCVDKAIRMAEEQRGVRREDISAILLVGGSSKIPMVKARLLDYFKADPKFVKSDLDGDLVVARGAAALAKRHSPSAVPFDILRELPSETQAADDIQLITEHSLGVGVQDNRVVHIVKAGTNLPVSVTRGGFINGGPTDVIPVPVFQGESESVFENDMMGIVELGPMEPRPEGHHKFEVTFKIDRNGLLNAIVSHLNEGKFYNKDVRSNVLGGQKALGEVRKQLQSLYQPEEQAPPPPPPIVIPPPGPTPPGLVTQTAPSAGGQSYQPWAPQFQVQSPWGSQVGQPVRGQVAQGQYSNPSQYGAVPIPGPIAGTPGADPPGQRWNPAAAQQNPWGPPPNSQAQPPWAAVPPPIPQGGGYPGGWQGGPQQPPPGTNQVWVEPAPGPQQPPPGVWNDVPQNPANPQHIQQMPPWAGQQGQPSAQAPYGYGTTSWNPQAGTPPMDQALPGYGYPGQGATPQTANWNRLGQPPMPPAAEQAANMTGQLQKLAVGTVIPDLAQTALRMAHKRLQQGHNPQLLVATNDLVAALNSGIRDERLMAAVNRVEEVL